MRKKKTSEDKQNLINSERLNSSNPTWRVICCGDRDWDDFDTVYNTLKRIQRDDIVIVHGAARGADRMSYVVAEGLEMSVEAYPANWVKYGKSAGPIRNQKMLDTGIDLVIAFHDDISRSKGTKDMIEKAIRSGVPVQIIGSKTKRK